MDTYGDEASEVLAHVSSFTHVVPRFWNPQEGSKNPGIPRGAYRYSASDRVKPSQRYIWYIWYIDLVK